MQDEKSLKTILQTLSSKFSQTTKSLGIDPNDVGSYTKLFHDLGSPILRIPEYVEALKLLHAEPQILSHIDKLVGDRSALRRISASEFLQTFLRWQYRLGAYQDPHTFDYCFNSFVEFFTSDTLSYSQLSRLHNFDCSTNEIILDDNVKIRRIIPGEILDVFPFLPKQIFDHSYESQSKSEFVIERTTAQKKIVRESNTADCFNDKDVNETQKYYAETGVVFDRLVRLLRLIKPSSVYRSHKLSENFLGYASNFGIRTSIPHIPNTVVGQRCELSSSDIEELKQLWKLLKSSGKVVNLALKRLSYSVERKELDDKLLDNFIALEALYLPDGSTELTFRLSIRVSKILGTSESEQSDIFFFLKDMYNSRSRLAHGKDAQVSHLELCRLEELLRKSIRKYLREPDKFTSDALNKILF